MRSSLGSWLLVTIEESKSAGSRSPRFSRRLKISAVLLFRLPCRRPGEKVCPGWNVIPISDYLFIRLMEFFRWQSLACKITECKRGSGGREAFRTTALHQTAER